MAVNVNLSRNTKVYFTTNQSTAGYGDHNTAEIQVLNGYTFSQGTDQQTIQINEAGATPNRGQRSFNTKLNPVDWKFSTYIRPKYVSTANASVTCSTAGTVSLITVNNIVTNAEITVSAAASIATSGMLYKVVGFTGTSTGCNSATVIPIHKVNATTMKWAVPLNTPSGTQAGTATLSGVPTNSAVEALLWNALVSPVNLMSSGVTPAWTAGVTSGTGATGPAKLETTLANAHQLAPFALIFKIDQIYYKVSGCALNSAEVNFGIDQIAQIAWSGFGTAYTSFATTAAQATEIAAITAYDSTPGFIMNKLSTVSIGSTFGAAYSATAGAVTAGTIYNLPITGGTININNNLTYMTPEVLGIVNQPVGYFTGTRAVTGNLTAYLRTGGTTETSDLLTAVIGGAASSPDNFYSMIINMGGFTNLPHVEFMFNGAMLQVPSVDVQDVVSTTINFTGQATDGSGYQLNAANEMQLRYCAA